MRANRSRLSLAVAGAVALFGLSACVPSATTSTKETLAPLVVPAVATTIVPIDTTAASTPPAGSTSAPAAGPTATAASSSAPAAGTDVTSTTNTSTTTTTPPLPTPGVYTVVARDTLSGIARRCSITPQALVEYNKWTDGLSHAIYPGTKVNLPCTPDGAVAATDSGATATTQSSVTATTTTGSASTTSTTVAPGPGGLYTIVAGDYLAAIAAKNKTTVDAIIAVNAWPDGVNHLIIPGQQIKLPAPSN